MSHHETLGREKKKKETKDQESALNTKLESPNKRFLAPGSKHPNMVYVP
jgi:hypothetical protein